MSATHEDPGPLAAAGQPQPRVHDGAPDSNGTNDQYFAVSEPGLTAVVCGSFRRNPEALRQDYEALVASGCKIISPRDLNFVAEEDGFMLAAHEVDVDPCEIEDLHLQAMERAHVIWMHVPNGYLGNSAILELGYAHALGLTVFASTIPDDQILAQLVDVVGSPAAAVSRVLDKPSIAPAGGLRALQRYYCRSAVERGWADERPEEIIELLDGELQELKQAIALCGADAVSAASPTGMEAADVQLYLVHLANVLGFDLAEAVRVKEAINEQRFPRSLTGSMSETSHPAAS
jgi:NTP pyrophosphatase (non-canonical NTP hydrolase)